MITKLVKLPGQEQHQEEFSHYIYELVPVFIVQESHQQTNGIDDTHTVWN
jgi:hypothetical protein